MQVALIAIAGAVVYSNTLHVQFIMDDYWVFTSSGPRGFLDTLLHGGSRRMVDATFSLNYHLHGMQVMGYHLVNLAIHLLSAITLYFLVVSALDALRQTFSYHNSRQAEPDFIDRFVPMAVALLFAIHPVQTQAVTYIIQRYTSLATLYYLLSALLFIRARLTFERSGSYRCPLFLGGLSLAAAILALGSKQIAATLPLMLIVLEIFLFRGRLINRRFCIACGSLAILAVGMLLIIWHDRALNDIFTSLHNATAENRYTGRAVYFLTQTRVVATYLRLLCLPFGQSLFYDYPVYNTLFSLPVLSALALHISLVTSSGLLLRQSSRNLRTESNSRGELQRLAALGIAWFYIAMIVESSIFPITDRIFEHRIYLPSIGFFLATVTVTALAVQGRQTSVRRVWLLLTVACLVLGGLTLARNNLWRDTLALWQDTARKAPNKDLAQINLGGEYMKLSMPEKALPLFVRALELNPDLPARSMAYLGKTLQYLHVDVARFTTGEELASFGNAELSREDKIRQASILYNNLALAYEYLGEPGKAWISYHTALRVNPSYDLAWYNLGLLSIKQGDRDQAAKALLELKRIKPYLADLLEATM
jgi:protein O-mannosyl-transferase